MRSWAGLLAIACTLVVLDVAPSRAVLCNHDNQRNAGEQCDGTDLGPLGCTDLCFEGGTLGCRADCTYDTSGCCVCGNGTRETTCNELCDGADLGGTTCAALGFPEGGTPACNGNCNGFVTDGCWWCGDAVKEGPEECDGADFGPAGNACGNVWPTHGGTVSCSPGNTPGTQYPNGCKKSTATCWICGDGKIDPGEDCDHRAANGTSGDTCDATCHVTGCGNGTVQSGEACDDGNPTANDGCTSCSQNRPYFGGGGEAYDECEQRWGLEATFSGGSQTGVTEMASGVTIQCTHNGAGGTAPCDRVAGDNACTFLTFYCMNLVSTDLSGCGPTQVKRVDVLSGTTIDAAPALAAIKATLDTLGGATTSLGSTSVVVNTPSTGVATRSICGQFTTLVPAGQVQTLNIQTRDNGTRIDVDQIRYDCR